MADDRVTRIVASIDDEIATYTKRAQETISDFSYCEVRGVMRGLERAKAIIEATR